MRLIPRNGFSNGRGYRDPMEAPSANFAPSRWSWGALALALALFAAGQTDDGERAWTTPLWIRKH